MNSDATKTEPPSTAGSRRIEGLDGLRGVAAMVVVLLHSLLLSDSFVTPFADPRPTTSPGEAMWWLTHTPLHLPWEGSVAVFVFFVLSGFVLCLPARHTRMNWRAYYPSRLVRLYIPVWASVGVALIWIYALPDLVEGSRFLQIHMDPVPLGILRDLILIVPAQPGMTNTVLWSLKWEIIFSLLLPLFILFAAKWRRGLALKVVFVLALLVVGAYEGPIERPYALGVLFQLPIFALGCLIAFEWDRLTALRDRLRNPTPVFAWLGVLTVLFISSYWMVFALPLSEGVLDLVAPATRVLQVLGAALLVILVILSPGLGAALSVRPLRWLGTRSFSLYLVHEPMIVAFGRLLPESINPLFLSPIVIVVALGLAEVFFRLVERPSHHLARRVARRFGSPKTPRPKVAEVESA